MVRCSPRCAIPRSAEREPLLQLRQSGLLHRTGRARRVRLRAGRRDAVQDTYRFGFARRIVFRAYPLSAVSQRIHNRNRTSFPSIFCASVRAGSVHGADGNGISDHVFHPAAAAFAAFALLPYGNALDGMIEADQRLRRAGRAAAAAQSAADACVLPAGIWRTGCAVSGARLAEANTICRSAACLPQSCCTVRSQLC